MFSSEEWNGEILRTLGEYFVLHERLKQSLSANVCSTRKCASRDMLFDMLGSRSLLGRNSMVGSGDVSKKIETSQRRLLQKRRDEDEVYMSQRKGSGVRYLQVESGNGEEAEGESIDCDEYCKLQQRFCRGRQRW